MLKPQGLGRKGRERGEVELSVSIHIYRLRKKKYISSPPSFASLSFPAVPASSAWQAQQGQMQCSVTSVTKQVAQPLEENEHPSAGDEMTSQDVQPHILLMWGHMDYFNHHHSYCTQMHALSGGLVPEICAWRASTPFDKKVTGAISSEPYWKTSLCSWLP